MSIKKKFIKALYYNYDYVDELFHKLSLKDKKYIEKNHYKNLIFYLRTKREHNVFDYFFSKNNFFDLEDKILPISNRNYNILISESYLKTISYLADFLYKKGQKLSLFDLSHIDVAYQKYINDDNFDEFIKYFFNRDKYVSVILEKLKRDIDLNKIYKSKKDIIEILQETYSEYLYKTIDNFDNKISLLSKLSNSRYHEYILSLIDKIDMENINNYSYVMNFIEKTCDTDNFLTLIEKLDISDEQKREYVVNHSKKFSIKYKTFKLC